MGIIIAIAVIVIILFIVVGRAKDKKRTTCDHCGTKYKKENVEVYSMGERKFTRGSGDDEIVEWKEVFDVVCQCPNCQTIKHKTAKLPLKVDVTDKFGTREIRPYEAYVKEQWYLY